MTLEVLRRHAELRAVWPSWQRLHDETPLGGPFQQPGWLVPWAERFVRDGDLHVVLAWDADRLVGLAPLYRRRVSGTGGHVLLPLATACHGAGTEQVALLAGGERPSRVLGLLVQHLAQVEGVLFARFTLAHGQGWLVPQWLPKDGTVGHHLATKAFVVWDQLPADERALLRGLKRNVREAVRRSTNRARGVVTHHLVDRHAPEQVPWALETLEGLHRIRAHAPGRLRHRHLFSDPRTAEFFRRAAGDMVRTGLGEVHLAIVDRAPAAALLVLRDRCSHYMSASGLDPRHWDLGLGTALTWEALRSVVAAGRDSLNFSAGPDTTKMRWSETLTYSHDFSVARPGRRARLTSSAYLTVAEALRRRDERRVSQ